MRASGQPSLQAGPSCAFKAVAGMTTSLGVEQPEPQPSSCQQKVQALQPSLLRQACRAVQAVLHVGWPGVGVS